MEHGYHLRFTRSAIIFDFEKTGFEESVEENGIEFHWIGIDRIRALLEALPGTTDDRTRLLAEVGEPAPRTPTRTEMLEALETDLPKLEHAAFLPEQRSRTVSWENLQTPNDEMDDADEQESRRPVVPTIRRQDQPRPAEPPATPRSHVAPPAPAKTQLPVTPGEESNQPLPSSEPISERPAAAGAPLSYDVVLGVSGPSPQLGLLGTVHGRRVALDLNQTHTISLFGVQGGGKSYTLGSIVEMATMAISGINELPRPLATVVFHYSSTQDYKPEFTTMNHPNSDEAAVRSLAETFQSHPQALSDIVLLAPVDKLEERRREYPELEVVPLTFASTELQANHWRFLMGAVGNQATYIRVMNQIMRGMRNNLTLSGLRTAMAASTLPEKLKELAEVRLNLAGTYIDDSARLMDVVRPGRLIIVDLRDEFIEKDEALGLFVVLLQLFADATCDGEKFNKLVVFDEAHKYIESPDLVAGLVSVVREMRHKGTSILVASQDPPWIYLSDPIIKSDHPSPLQFSRMVETYPESECSAP